MNQSKKVVHSINPYSLEKIGEYSILSDNEVDGIISSAHKCFKNQWSKTTFKEREVYFLNLKKLLLNDIDNLADLITCEMGKLKSEAFLEIKKCAELCEYYAQNAKNFLSDEQIKTDYDSSYITYQPLGVILAVMPWNFPFWQVFRFAVPTLFAGNTALLKHASSVTGSALKIEELFKKAGFPNNSFNTLVIPSGSVKRVIENQYVQAVSLTGSEAAGRSVAKVAGENLKKVVLELGGNDPYLIFPDIDIDKVVQICIKGRLVNNGQSCISPKRLIIHTKIYNEFKTQLLKIIKEISFTDPRKASNEKNLVLTPLNSIKARNDLHDNIVEAKKYGAQCLLGGEIPLSQKGAFYPMTVLENITETSKAFDTEMFGPVFCLYEANTVDHAIELANNSSFGLGGAVFSKDLTKARKIATEGISTGTCFVNDFVRSNQHLPFGGVRNSGYGRELSYLGLREFTNIKTIAINKY